MSDPSIPVQKALNDRLKELTNAEVYDAVPQNAAYPYVVIDDTTILPDDPLAKRRDERIVYLSVWSKYRGQKEVLSILAQIDQLLHRQRLPMDTGRMVQCFVIGKLTRREPDNLTFQGRATLRIITEH